MPTYDYKCKACGHTMEAFQSMKAAPLRKCPECGKNSLERQIGTGAAILFKGGGFYQTDYRSESYKKAADADKPKAEKTDISTATEKPAAAAPTPAAESKPAPAPAPAESKPAARTKSTKRSSR